LLVERHIFAIHLRKTMRRSGSARVKILLPALSAALLLSAFALLHPAPSGGKILRIATTTSLDATGLLDALKSEFERRNPGVNVTWVAVGTGQALEIARRGDADLVLTHDRPLEDEFIRQGYGVHGVSFACNEFVVVGPPEDPAGVSQARDVVEAFRRVAEAGDRGLAVFVSRGDRSGTHLRELRIWDEAGVNPRGRPWYRETGQGMSQTLVVADQLRAYTLVDAGTFAKFKERVGLRVLFRGDTRLLNVYRAILVNPERFPWVNHQLAFEFVRFLVSPEGQRIIAEYEVGGVKLFQACFGGLSELGVHDPYEEEQVAYWLSQLGK